MKTHQKIDKASSAERFTLGSPLDVSSENTSKPLKKKAGLDKVVNWGLHQALFALVLKQVETVSSKAMTFEKTQAQYL